MNKEKKMIKQSGIYKIICINNKFYIGSSVNIGVRLKDHVRLLKRNKHQNKYLQNSWNKYGEKNFRFEIIENIRDTNQLPIREKWWINNTKCYKREVGFNISKDPCSPGSERLIDLTGQKFNRLAPLKYMGKTKDGKSKWLCLCDCNKETIVRGDRLKSGHTKSCGCLHKENGVKRGKSSIKHGHFKNNRASKTQRVWDNMIQRCTNKNDRSYKNYGAKGITICERWLPKNNGFINFLADVGEIPEVLTLYRINSGGNYEPNNWRMGTQKEHYRNRRNK